MNEKRRMGGLRSKMAGAAWEHLFEHSAWRAGCTVIRIPDGCKQIGGGKLVRVKSPFDFVIIKGGKSVFLDTKTTLKKYWSCSDNDPKQLYWLAECAKAGARAGYAVNFRALNVTVFFGIEKLSGLKARQSLGPEDGVKLSLADDRLDLGGLFYERQEIQRSKDFGPLTIPVNDDGSTCA